MTGGDATREVAGCATGIGDHSTRLWSAAGSEAAVVEGFPQWLDAYRRERRLGHGGMGVVYRYRDTKLDRLVAVKTMPPAFARDPKWRKRFSGEAKALAALDHPNIAKIHHVVEYAGSDFLILEYVPGVTLTEELSKGALPLERALSIGWQIGRAITAGHSLHVIHLDIKPGNIMVTAADVAKLLDYGLARHDPPTRPADPASASTPMIETTERGQVMGTPGYMSPEQTCGMAVDERTDVWAFGCVLFECLTGRPAFPGATNQGRIAATMHAEPDWKALPLQTPPHVRHTLESCLRKDPQLRLRHIDEACLELERTHETPRRAKPKKPVPHNLPTQLTTFVSRAGEIEKLKDLMTRARLLTLTGPGGSGKTRLALELARASLAAGGPDEGGSLYPDGVWLVELASLSGADLLPQAVASALKVRVKPRPERTLLQHLVDRLSGRTLLMVLDNCEHLVSACAMLVGDLLRHCPHLRVIATSRQSLGVAGEQPYDVPALSYPAEPSRGDLTRYEAVQMFTARAALARPGFALSERNGRAVGEICRRLEGIPLAIELAAARVRSLRAEEIAERLFEVLDPSHLLESSIALSAQLLSGPERTMLGRLSVFRGGWTLEASESVCATPGRRPAIRGRSVVDLLSRLVDTSLAVYEEREDRARYHLLEIVRDYSQRHLLKPAAAVVVRRRHLAFFLRLAREAYANFDNEQVAWLNRLEVEHDNFRAALEFSGTPGVRPTCGARLATAMHMLWRMRGYFGEGRYWLDQILARRPATRDVLHLRTLNAAGNVAWGQCDFGSAKAYYEEALSIARERRDRRRSAAMLTNLGLLAQEQGELAASRRLHAEAMAIYEALNSEYGVAMVQLNLGVVAKLEGKFDEARHLLDQSVSVFRQRGDWERVGGALRNLGEVACRHGAHDDGVQLLRRGLEVMRQLRDKKETASALLWIALARQKQGLPEHAARIVAAAEALREDVGSLVSREDADAYECCREALRRQLGESAVRELSREGRAMTYDKAVAYAISDAPAGTLSVGDSACSP